MSDEVKRALDLAFSAIKEVKRLRKRNEFVALAQEHGAIDLSDYGWPQWEEEA